MSKTNQEESFERPIYKVGQLLQVIDYKPKDRSAAYLSEGDLNAKGVVKEIHTEGSSHGIFYVLVMEPAFVTGYKDTYSYYQHHLVPAEIKVKFKNKI